ncbi:MAG TPA: XRE family transcriptional regulator [Caulobacteraceae bacterium]|jgi:transcriptional regulator with XRE-family HTH domain|nr:XRE family transcriptional regulator [Caulobacteraceae bacterium]
MLKTADELLQALGASIRARRIAQGWSQREASDRSGVPLRTWRRLEATGEGSVKHLTQAAIALRCEDNLALMFPPPVAASMDALLARQAAEAEPKPRQRISRKHMP